MRILILGSSGIIGSSLLSFLSSYFNGKDTEIHGCSSQNLNLLIKEDVENFVSENSRYNIIIFLVGLAHSKGKKKDLDQFYNINFKTLRNLFKYLKKYKKIPDKIIFSSSISVYGERYGQNKYKEESLKIPLSPYAVTKLMAEDYLLTNFKSITWILRFSPVYSKTFRLNLERRTLIFKKLFRVGNGRKKLSLCNLRNINIVIKNIINGGVPSGAYNISDNKIYIYNDLLRQYNDHKIIPIPIFSIYIVYVIGIISNNIFLRENSLKLMTDNIYCSKKIRNYIRLNYILKDL